MSHYQAQQAKHRVVKELKWARLSNSRSETKIRGRSPNADGLRFQRQLEVEAAPFAKREGFELKTNQWIEFADAGGFGQAQPDFYLVREDGIILVECKRTFVRAGLLQMSELYVPLLSHIYSRPITRVLACKFLSPEFPSELDIIQNLGHTLGQMEKELVLFRF